MKRHITLWLLFSFCVLALVSGCGMQNDHQGGKPMENNVVETESPIIQFKDEEMHYCFCDSVDVWRFDKNPENVFDVTEAECAEIEFINIHCATRFETLEDLRYLKNLKRLWMYPLPEPEDIRDRRAKMREHSAELVAQLEEILPQFEQLEEVRIGSDMTVRNLSFLRNVKGLRRLTILTGTESLSDIDKMLLLEFLIVDDGSIEDISPIRELKNLKHLSISMHKVSDITPLQSLENLERLFLSNNNITDITPLQSLENLEWLDLSDNNISDITPLLGLKKLREIRLYGNPVCENEEQMKLLREAFPEANIVTVDPRSEEAGN